LTETSESEKIDISEQEQVDFKRLMKEAATDKNLKSLVNAVIDRIDLKWDIVIAIDGEEGSGKSSLGMIMGYLLDSRFHLESNIAYLPSSKEMEHKFWALDSKQVFLVDEAIKALYKLKFMDRFQTRINEMYATERWQSKITLLLLPRFTDLNEFFRNSRVKFWIHVIDRGVAVAFAKDEVNIFGTDKWHLKEEYNRIKNTIRGKRYATFTTDQKLAIYRKSLHYMFDFTFRPLPDAVEAKYTLLKQFFRRVPEEREKAVKETMIIKLSSMDKLDLNQRQIAEAVGVTEGYVSYVINKHKSVTSK